MKRYSNNIKERLSGRHKKCMALVGSVATKNIFDLGCSFGWFEKYALENNCNSVVGLDCDTSLLQEAKDQIKDKRVTFLRGDVLDLPFKSENFDLVVMFDVIEHIPKNTERQALSEASRVLKNGGSFYLSTPNRNFVANIFDPAWYFGHRHYNIKQLKRLLLEQHLLVEDYGYGGGWWDIVYIFLLYFFKWVLRREAPLKNFFDQMRDREYLNKEKMFNIIFIKAKKAYE